MYAIMVNRQEQTYLERGWVQLVCVNAVGQRLVIPTPPTGPLMEKLIKEAEDSGLHVIDVVPVAEDI